MSSLFDVPPQLVMILSLAAAGAGEAPELTAPPAAVTRPAPRDDNPFRFTEQRWLEGVRAGDGHTPHAARVFRTSGGKYYVPAESDRRAILRLRRDRSASARTAFALARRNAEVLAPELGRPPTAGELYLAHCFGGETAIALVRLAIMRPHESLTVSLSELVAEHPELRDTSRDVVIRLLTPFDRGIIGADVAQWFRRGGGPTFAVGLRGSQDEPEGPTRGQVHADALAALQWTAEVRPTP